MKMKTIIFSIIFVTSNLASAGGPVLPEKWRVPTKNEAFQKYSDSHLNTLISGDFDGNGLVDGATIVITADNSKQELLVFMYSDKDEHERWQVLDSIDFTNKISMGLSKVKPGLHKVLCITNEECEKGYKKEIVIENDSINYFRPESANSIFILTNGKFERIWQSD